MRYKEYTKVDVDPKYYERLAQVESSNNPNAKAATSSAAGLYQFTEGTWKEHVSRAGLDYNLNDRFDPKKSRDIVERFTKQNEKYLKKALGREPDQGELYLSHFAGMGGARKILLNPDEPIENILSADAIKANKVLFEREGITKGKDMYRWAAKKFNVAPKNTKPVSNDLEGYKPKQYNTKEQNYLAPKTGKYQTAETYVPPKEESKQEGQKVSTEKAKQSITKKQILEDYISIQNNFANQPEKVSQPQYPQQDASAYINIETYQDGGEIPISKDGLYEYPNQQVIVPTKDGRITMKNIDYPVKGVSQETGEEIVMQPGQEYKFKNTKTVLETPIRDSYQRGGIQRNPQIDNTRVRRNHNDKIPFKQEIRKYEEPKQELQKISAVESKTVTPQSKNKTLRIGDQGINVREVQAYLTAKGFDTKGVDGKYGKNTAEAVKKFQKSQGLKPDGIIGKNTMKAFNSKSEPNISPQQNERLVYEATTNSIPTVKKQKDKRVGTNTQNTTIVDDVLNNIPISARQFVYSSFGGEGTITENDLNKDEFEALKTATYSQLNQGEKKLDYDVWRSFRGTDKDTEEEDMDIFNPYASLQKTLGQASITVNDKGDIFVEDQYNFNDAGSKDKRYKNNKRDGRGLLKMDEATSFSNTLYRAARNYKTLNGKGEGEGSLVKIKIGNINDKI